MARLVDIILNVSGRLDGIKQSIKGTADFEGRWERMTKRVRASAQAMARRVKQAMAVVGAAVVTGAVQATKSAADFDKSMRSVFTLLPGASKEMREELIKGARQLAKEYGLPLQEVTSAMYDAISAGVPPDNVYSFLQDGAKVAIGGAADIKTAVNGLTSVVNAYRAQGLSAAEASDYLFTAMRLGKTDIPQLASQLGMVAPLAASLGIEFKDVAAGLGAITSLGVSTATATTQMRALFSELSRAASKSGAVFKEITGKTFPQFIRGGGTVAEAMALMRTHAVATGVELNNLFTSSEAGNAALNLSTQSFIDAGTAMTESFGATAEAYAEMEQSISVRVAKLKARFNDFGISVGQALLPAVEAMEAIFSGREIADSTMSGVKILGLRLLKVAGTFTGYLIDKMTSFNRGFIAAIGASIGHLRNSIGTVFEIVVNRLQSGVLKATKLLFDQINKISDSSLGQFLGLGRLDTSGLEGALKEYEKEFNKLNKDLDFKEAAKDVADAFKETLKSTPIADRARDYYDGAIAKQERLLKLQQEKEKEAREEELKAHKEAAIKMGEALRKGGDQAGESIKQDMVEAAKQTTQEQSPQSLVPEGGRMERYRDAAGREQTRIFDASGRIVRDRGQQTMAGGLTSLSPIEPASSVVGSTIPTPTTSTANREKPANQTSLRRKEGEITSAGGGLEEAIAEMTKETVSAINKVTEKVNRLSAQIKDQRNV